MRFREFVQLTEAGHFKFTAPKTITVMLDGEPVTFKDVAMIDPRFEFHNLPPSEGSAMKKFVGESPFSLPLVSPQGHQSGWLVSDERSSMFSGRGHWSDKPFGRYEDIPLNWAEKAQIMDDGYGDLVAAHRDQKTTAGAHQQPLQTGTHGPTPGLSGAGPTPNVVG